jgi:hypothetical protein
MPDPLWRHGDNVIKHRSHDWQEKLLLTATAIVQLPSIRWLCVTGVKWPQYRIRDFVPEVATP